jgi:hypothetical protein
MYLIPSPIIGLGFKLINSTSFGESVNVGGFNQKTMTYLSKQIMFIYDGTDLGRL